MGYMLYAVDDDILIRGKYDIAVLTHDLYDEFLSL